MNIKYSAFAFLTVFALPSFAFSATDSGEHLRGAIYKKPPQTVAVSYTDERTANVVADASVAENSDQETELVLETKAPLPYIGENKKIRTKYEDTLLELARKYNVGYVEMIAANPGIDPWLPGEDREIILPKRTLIPDVPREGIVINLAEMRMYSFLDDANNPKTYPIGVGRDGLNTPTGVTKIVRKKEGPSWRPTERMRKADPTLPAVVPPGEDNPLGTHALYLGWPQYLIHGTHKPLGVGRRVSSGCIRMYPEDILKVFKDVPIGTQVRVIKEPVKLAWIDDMLYLEAHAEDELADSYEQYGKIKEYKVPPTLFSDLEKVAGDKKDQLDWNVIRTALKQRNGMPVAILLNSDENNAGEEVEITEDILKIEPELPEPEPKAPPKKWHFNS